MRDSRYAGIGVVREQGKIVRYFRKADHNSRSRFADVTSVKADSAIKRMRDDMAGMIYKTA